MQKYINKVQDNPKPFKPYYFRNIRISKLEDVGKCAFQELGNLGFEILETANVDFWRLWKFETLKL